MLVSNPPRSIVITGHTDNVPAGPNFSSNLQLSALRAVNFAEILLQSNSKLDGRNFSTQGFGENRAVAPNDTKEGRAKNRRVEVLIQPLVTEDGSAVKVQNRKKLLANGFGAFIANSFCLQTSTYLRKAPNSATIACISLGLNVSRFIIISYK